jgi:3-oxoacyl-[acyl-carrier protein] reductase
MSVRKGVAWVSGGSRGLGLEIVRTFLEDGYTVATFSRKSSPDISNLIAAHPGVLRFVAADLADPTSLSAFAHAVADLGVPSILVNNAGVALEGFLGRQTEAEIARTVSVNLTGTLLLTRLAARTMMVQGYGRIISISSIVGLTGFKGVAAYSAAKAGIDGMTRSLARELGGRGILVNAIAPGFLETEMVGGLDERERRRIARRTPLERLGRVDDITGVVRFLVSNAAGFLTGQTIVVDGGLTS